MKMNPIAEIQKLKAAVNSLERYVLASQSEWVPADAYAEAKGIKTSTVNAYCRNGIIEHCRKNGTKWEIHRSLL